MKNKIIFAAIVAAATIYVMNAGKKSGPDSLLGKVANLGA